MKLPNQIGPIHFVGIGGIGMSGIAEVLLNLGHQVQGSDQSDNANVKRLREQGATVFVGHDKANLGAAAVVVISSAVKRDNPEVVEARARRIPVVRRAEMLAELMRLKQCVAVAGTHGKTTTTSLVATLLDAAGLDPTVINGGIINAYGTNARLGAGDWMVVEADESDGTFLKLPADIAVVTNIDPEHLDHFKTFDAIKDAFLALIGNLPFYGFAVMCLDHPTVQELVGQVEDRRILTYGENPQADVRLMDVNLAGGVTRFSVLIRDRATGRATFIDDLALPMPGRHNALNATAAIAVAHELGAPIDVIRKAIAGFGGVRRRFTRTGTWNGVAIYDDYGHHPVEIAAVLRAARAATEGKVIAVVQPHRFTRLASLFDAFATCFNDADTVIVADVYRGRRSADRGRRQGGAGDRDRRPRPSSRADAALARQTGGHGAFAGEAGRLCHLPRRRVDHAMGLCAARRTRRARQGLTLRRCLAWSMKSRRGRPSCADASQPTRRSPRRPGFGSAVRLRRCFPRPTRTISPTSSSALPREIPVTTIGLGSNLIVRDGGVAGLVIRLGGRAFGAVEVMDGSRVVAGAAAPDQYVAKAAAIAGVDGLAFLRGVPGSIGGALVMNAGAHGGEIKDVLIEARGIDRTGAKRVFSNAEMGFSYRHSLAPR